MKGKVLVVDDSVTIRNYLKQVLTGLGFEVETSSSIWISGLITDFKPHLILMDLNYGNTINGQTRSGEMAIETLKRNRLGHDIAIVIYSSEDESILKEVAKRSGADGYISKDLDEKDLRRSITRYMLKHAS